jgi:hypothetical protein
MKETLNEHFDVDYIGMPYPTIETGDLKTTHNLKLNDCKKEYKEMINELNERIS